MLRSLYSFFKAIPTMLRIFKVWKKKRSINETIAEYLRLQYPFIVPVEKMKSQIKVLQGLPTLETMVGMQRKALKRTLLSVGISLVVATALVFVLRHLLLALNTPYTFFDLIVYPFVRFWSLFLR
jgi:hypothetical protein